jgi:hypothetical protein
MNQFERKHPDYEGSTIANLIADGVRYVYYPGEKTQDGSVIIDVVFEGYPLRFPSGQISNAPDATLPLAVPPDVEDPETYLRDLSVQHGLCVDADEYGKIIASSLGASARGGRIKVKFDPEAGCFIIFDGFGNEVMMDCDEARRLYRTLADELDLGRNGDCPSCGDLLTIDRCCNWCGPADAMEDEDDD